MNHKRLMMVLGVFAVAGAGLTAWLLGVATGSAAGHTQRKVGAAVTIVTVTAGKPTELGFKLSKSSLLPAGTITFKVTNKGVATHNFEICATPVNNIFANSCKGTTTKMLKPGQSATVTVTLKKKGQYQFLCSVPGHASAGMKGLLGVGVKVGGSSSVPAGTVSSKPQTQLTGAPCNSPQASTVMVSEFEMGFTLSQSTVPCGTVTFVQTNTGAIEHNWELLGAPGATGLGAYILPGASTTNVVTLTPGSYGYLCDVATHAALGMQGRLTVT
jgi:uncharacterized cupredoxin-like copper-binding protein